MNIPGYDAWRLAGPPEPDGPTCDYCGGGNEVRVVCEGFYHRGKTHPAALTCADCYESSDEDGHCFDDLQLAAEYYQDQADARADYLHDQARDRRGEE